MNTSRAPPFMQCLFAHTNALTHTHTNTHTYTYTGTNEGAVVNISGQHCSCYRSFFALFADGRSYGRTKLPTAEIIKMRLQIWSRWR